jgi:hypothetical protein
LAEVTRWTSSSGCIIIAEKRGRVVKINGADLTNPSWRPSHLSVLILIAAAILIYCTYLHYAPIYLAHDEVIYALTARSIALTGCDLNGEFLPALFHIVSGTAATTSRRW